MNNNKFTYFAMIDGNEVELRKSTHEYHFACLRMNMYAKTKEQLISRIHSEAFHMVNWYKKVGFYETYNPDTKETKRHSLNSKEFKERIAFAERIVDQAMKAIVEVYTK